MSDNISEMRGLWRGKDVDDSMWVSGDLLQIPELDGHGKIVSTKPAIMERTPVAKCYYVDPSTLGECSGVCDKKGNPIFEGDIVEVVGINEKQIAPVAFRKGFFIVDEKYSKIRLGVGAYKRQQLKVIGNIHDSPKLLKGGK